MKLYYWAAQLRAAMFYFLPDEVPAWVDTEKHGIKLPIHLYLYSSQAKKLKKNTHNPFLRNTITIWYEARALMDQNTFSYFTPFWGNADFKPGRQDLGVKHWMDLGLKKIGDLFSEGTLMSFQQLVQKFNLPRKHFLNTCKLGASYIRT